MIVLPKYVQVLFSLFTSLLRLLVCIQSCTLLKYCHRRTSLCLYRGRSLKLRLAIGSILEYSASPLRHGGCSSRRNNSHYCRHNGLKKNRNTVFHPFGRNIAQHNIPDNFRQYYRGNDPRKKAVLAPLKSLSKGNTA